MIIGIGTDLVFIERIKKIRDRFPEAFPRRLLTKKELQDYEKAVQRGQSPGKFLAKKFAAKEACLKALGTGMIQGISWHDMEITHLKSGQPLLTLKGGCLEVLGEQLPEGYEAQIFLSITDETSMALAFVVISVEKKG